MKLQKTKKTSKLEQASTVIAQLKVDPKTFSGYEWSSSDGTKLAISPGTTTNVRVTVEERSPITFVLPILKEWSGIDNL